MSRYDRDYFNKWIDQIYNELNELAQEAQEAGANNLYRAAANAFTELEAYSKEINESINESTTGVSFKKLRLDLMVSSIADKRFKETNQELINALKGLGFEFEP